MGVPHLRLWILVLATVCLTLIVANILSLQFTIICMLHPRYLPGAQRAQATATPTAATLSPNGSFPQTMNGSMAEAQSSCSPDGIHFGKRLKWGPAVQATIYSAFAWGSVLATLPLSWLIQHYGTRRVLSLIGFISAVATMLSPWAAYQGYGLFIVCRILMGVSYTALFPAIGAITTHWATINENGLFMGMLGSATQLAPVIATPISGLLCSSSWGWPAVFYVHGLLTFAAFAVFAALYRNKPRKHPLICPKEVELIDRGKPALVNREDPPVPYRCILRSVPVWAALAACLSNMCGSNIVLLFTPTYLTTVLRFDISSVAFLSTLPTLLQFFVKFLGGYASDQLPLSDTTKVKLFNSLALLGMAVFLLFLAVVPPSHQYTALSMLVLSMAFLGFHSGGFFKAVTLMSMEFAPIVMGMVTAVDTLVWLLTPYVIAAAAPNGTFAQWQNVFYGTAGLLFTSGLVFIAFGSGETEDWALSEAQKLSMGYPVATQETFIHIEKEMTLLDMSRHSILDLDDSGDPEAASLVDSQVTIKI